MTQIHATLSNQELPNGAGAAAVLAAGIGSLVLGVLTMAGDKFPAVKSALIFYKPTGPLSGVTTLSILAWLGVWGALHVMWGKRDVSLKGIVMAAFGLLAVALLLTFPPLIDVL